MIKPILFSLILVICAAFPILAGSTAVSHPDRYQIEDGLQPLFDALRDGDVETIKMFVGGEMYERRKRLFEQNKEYPQFLRDHYKGATFEVVGISPLGERLIANIRISLQNGNKSNVQFHLEKLMLEGQQERWIVVKEIVN